MKIRDHLSEDTKKEIHGVKSELEIRQQARHKKKENLSYGTLRGMMSARSYYRGPGGAMRQR